MACEYSSCRLAQTFEYRVTHTSRVLSTQIYSSEEYIYFWFFTLQVISFFFRNDSSETMGLWGIFLSLLVTLKLYSGGHTERIFCLPNGLSASSSRPSSSGVCSSSSTLYTSLTFSTAARGIQDYV